MRHTIVICILLSTYIKIRESNRNEPDTILTQLRNPRHFRTIYYSHEPPDVTRCLLPPIRAMHEALASLQDTHNTHIHTIKTTHLSDHCFTSIDARQTLSIP